MTDAGRDPEQRVLALAPTARDGELTRSMLEQAFISCTLCADLDALCRHAEAGAGALLVPEEAILDDRSGQLPRLLSAQPPWSDLPVIVLARSGADSEIVRRAMNSLGNVTVLERPMRIAALVSTLRAALRARQRQLQIRGHLAERARAEADLREADRRKDEFLAILAHELRNPLAPIRSAIDILHLRPAGDPATEHMNEMMRRQVDHMVRLVDDLLEVSRITRGTIELQKERVDLGTVLRAAAETARPLIEPRGQRLELSIPSAPLFLEGDPVRLAQIFTNLLNNASKYTPEKGQIWVDARRDGEQGVVSVRDTGAGIPPDVLPRVFEMFARGDRALERSRGGLGIGLTLVKTHVELHGGRVEARSDGLGSGSEFVVHLPLAPAPRPGEPAGRKPARSMRLASQRILVVDDNEDAASSLGMLLQMRGAEVHVVYDGPSALKEMESFVPSAVLLDIGMPGMDGYEVARRIRERPEHRDVTLIALTGWGQQEDRDRARAAGFGHHLTKPADVRALEAMLTTEP